MGSAAANGDDAQVFTTAWSPFLDSWVRVSKQWTNSVVEANRAIYSSLGLGDDVVSRSVDSVAYERSGWSSERSVSDRAHISVGDTARFAKSLTEEDIRAFAELSGDTNRLHLDDDFAANTRFGRRIGHGTLVSGLISAALARLPGVTIYLSQNLEFIKPLDIGDRATAVVEVIESLGDGRYRLSTDVLDEDDEPYVTGEAVVLIDPLPDDGDPAGPGTDTD